MVMQAKSTLPGPESSPRLAWSAIFAYGAPGIGAGYMFLLLSLYMMKFATDVLLIAPAVMGTIFGLSRIWDAVSDPLAGYYSDSTTHAFGRRRLWLLISITPIALSFIMVFSPPVSLEGYWLIVWIGTGVILFYSAMTVFVVPHMSLGAELTEHYHERSRLYGLRHAAYTIGSILAVASMQLFINAEASGAGAVRATASTLAIIAAIITTLSILYAVFRLRERADFQGRSGSKPFDAFRDVWRNTHARLLLLITLVENIGSATIGVLTLYIASYVIGRPELGPAIILTYMVPSMITVSIWIPLSRRFGKIRLWMYSMIVTGICFGAMIFLPFVEESVRVWCIFTGAVFAGSAAGCGGTIGPSVQSDVIDYDEYLTGERKEGSYFAAWNFVQKGATGIMVVLTGYVLQFAGFIPNQVQDLPVQLAMVALYGLFPLCSYLAGALLFLRFTLDESEHVRIRLALDQRRSEQAT